MRKCFARRFHGGPGYSASGQSATLPQSGVTAIMLGVNCGPAELGNTRDCLSWLLRGCCNQLDLARAWLSCEPLFSVILFPILNIRAHEHTCVILFIKVRQEVIT